MKMMSQIKLLGLSDAGDDGPSQADRLFVVEHWPAKLRVPYQIAEGKPRKLARIAAQRIDFFIKTKGTDDDTRTKRTARQNTQR